MPLKRLLTGYALKSCTLCLWRELPLRILFAAMNCPKVIGP